MDRVTAMQAAGQSYSVKFLEITRAFGKDPNLFICVFEGEDGKYYSPRVSFALGAEKWYGVNAGGKAKVLEVHEILTKHPLYKFFRFACFIDADYDHWTDHSKKTNLYCTKTYSIENFYTTPDAIREIIANEFGVSEFGDEAADFNKIIYTYLEILDITCSALSEFNYIAKAHRIMERDEKTKFKLNLSNVKLSDLIQVGLDDIVIVYNVENPITVFKDAKNLAIDDVALEEAKITLPKKSWPDSFRGKQQIDFLRTWLSILKQDRCSKNPSFCEKPGNVKLSLSKDNCLSELSQYATTPQCLRDFLAAFALVPEPSRVH
ncbi:DUF4435 domain-containing protein [Massilia sp. NP310]|uniref:DUF4435 domain-containing protein n=1 Tax=Massilia sp. NP310 TaxID=2861282 RepID=UPI001C624927|nr:DUF4435 domain-containing protein [Massilia sp. NP310]QYG03947.1 DUF4435 domain-containing protein [Massilia sp. NP310]